MCLNVWSAPNDCRAIQPCGDTYVCYPDLHPNFATYLELPGERGAIHIKNVVPVEQAVK